MHVNIHCLAVLTVCEQTLATMVQWNKSHSLCRCFSKCNFAPVHTVKTKCCKCNNSDLYSPTTLWGTPVQQLVNISNQPITWQHVCALGHVNMVRTTHGVIKLESSPAGFWTITTGWLYSNSLYIHRNHSLRTLLEYGGTGDVWNGGQICSNCVMVY